MHTWDYLPKFIEALAQKLENDETRWGDTWLKRTRKGQEVRTIENFRNKFDKFLNAGEPIDWLAITGDAFICWIRENYPELWPE